MSDLNTKVGRNSPCPCGALRPNGLRGKYKNCCMNKKTRTTQVLFGFKDKPAKLARTSKNELVAFNEKGEVVLPIHSFNETFYTKNNGGKKTVSYFEGTQRDALEHLRPFDLVYAIDTNTEIVDGVSIAVACIFQITVGEIGKNETSFYLLGPWFLRFKNGKGGMDEKLSIILLVNEIETKIGNEDKTVAIITDHDLGNHRAYNKQEKPIYFNNSLPKNFSLMYASGDSNNKNTNPLTLAVSSCDKRAKEEFTFFKEYRFFDDGKYALILENMIDADNHSGRIGVPVFKK